VTYLVIDAGVLLSAAVARRDGPLVRLMGAVAAGAVEMVACDQLFVEVEKGLRGTYFRDRLTEEQRVGIPSALRRIAAVLPDPELPTPVLRDPSDDYLLALARAAKATAIVTGDRDLLDHIGLDPPALSPRAACVRLGLFPET